VNISRCSKIGFASVFIIGVIYIYYLYQPHSNDDFIDQGPISDQDQFSLNTEKGITVKKPNGIQKAKVSKSSYDDRPKPDVLKIQDPDAVEIVGFPKIVNINIGGEIISREFSSMEIRKFPVITLENSSEYINALKPLVEEGSGPAAYKLRSLLESCLKAPRDETTYRQNERSILQENKATHGMSVDQHLTYNQALFLRCQGVSDETLKQESLDELFDLAVESGSQLALSELANSHISNGEYVKAGARLKELWESGNTNSGGSLGFIYENSDFDGPDPTKPNLVKSYAYKFAQDLVNTAARQTASYYNPSLDSMSNGDEQNARDIAVSQLTPQQLKEADQLAKSLVKNNTNCCIWVWSVE